MFSIKSIISNSFRPKILALSRSGQELWLFLHEFPYFCINFENIGQFMTVTLGTNYKISSKTLLARAFNNRRKNRWNPAILQEKYKNIDRIFNREALFYIQFSWSEILIKNSNTYWYAPFLHDKWNSMYFKKTYHTISLEELRNWWPYPFFSDYRLFVHTFTLDKNTNQFVQDSRKHVNDL